MKFTPKTATELAEEGLFPAGVYDCEVLEAADAVSAKGNDMIKVKLKVFSDTSERTQFVYDYLMEAMGWKLRNAAEAFGLLENYDRGEMLAEDFEGKVGKVKIKIDPAKDGYAAKNAVADYVMTGDAPKKTFGAKKPALADLDDAVPF